MSGSRLRDFVRKGAEPVVERCELCAKMLASVHPHLLNLESRQIACSCDACAMLFDRPEARRYRRIPRDTRYLPDFRLDEALWDELHVPINMAFFFQDTSAERVRVMYPSPAGATDATLSLETWPALIEANPILADFQPDVEALLVNRVRQHRDHYRAPIDRCFELVGLIRSNWRGLSGGEEVWQKIDAFFARLKG